MNTPFIKTLEKTLGSRQWVGEHQGQLLLIFPEVLTHQENLDIASMMRQFYQLGIRIYDQTEFTTVIGILEKLKIFKRINGWQIQRNIHFDINAHVDL